jgi:hypothetical protein
MVTAGQSKVQALVVRKQAFKYLFPNAMIDGKLCVSPTEATPQLPSHGAW